MLETFTVKSLSQRWHVNAQAVRRLIAEGGLKAFRVGALVRITHAEVTRYESPETERTGVAPAGTKSSGAADNFARSVARWKKRQRIKRIAVRASRTKPVH